MILPDSDDIRCLKKRVGMYDLSRWPETVSGQIEFLQAIANKFGKGSHMHIGTPSDGYPGYIQITPEADILSEQKELQREQSLKRSGLRKLTHGERIALGLRHVPNP